MICVLLYYNINGSKNCMNCAYLFQRFAVVNKTVSRKRGAV